MFLHEQTLSKIYKSTSNHHWKWVMVGGLQKSKIILDSNVYNDTENFKDQYSDDTITILIQVYG